MISPHTQALAFMTTKLQILNGSELFIDMLLNDFNSILKLLKNCWIILFQSFQIYTL